MQGRNKDAASIFRYWGKAKPREGCIPYHLLPYHCLDVAAVGRLLLRQQKFSVGVFAKAAGLSEAALAAAIVFFLTLHDIGKFARGFQNLAQISVTN
ncbi:MAG: hypothetical protein H7X91_06415 [Burkholderiales bacterium]|nr:hypothetical protein [Burkholderiales bacterium]